MSMVMVMVMVMARRRVAGKPVRAQKVHGQSHDGDEDGLPELDVLGHDQPLHRLEDHECGHPEQQQRAGVSTQHFDLPGPKGITPVACVRAYT